MNALALSFLLGIPLAAAGKPVLDLTSGRYAVKVTGLLTRTCERAVVEELSRLPEVEKAGASLEKDEVYVFVRLGRSLRASALKKALTRASKRVNLGSPIEIESVRYKVETSMD